MDMAVSVELLLNLEKVAKLYCISGDIKSGDHSYE